MSSFPVAATVLCSGDGYVIGRGHIRVQKLYTYLNTLV